MTRKRQLFFISKTKCDRCAYAGESEDTHE